MTYVGVKSFSANALAILVVDDADLSGFGPEDIVTIPAHTEDSKPIVLKAALVHCGDKNITCVVEVPKMEVNAVSASVIKFTSERALVTKWDDAAIPLHQGTNIPTLPTATLAIWAIKCLSHKQDPHSKPRNGTAFSASQIAFCLMF